MADTLRRIIQHLISHSCAMGVRVRVKVSHWRKLKLWFKTCFYNSSFSYDYTKTTFAQPFFWFIDKSANFLGRFLVIMFCCLIGSVVAFAYLVGVPIYWERSPVLATCLLLVGHWILVNIIFHYYQACKVSPGLPIDFGHLLPAQTSVTICHKCIYPKPPRAHHCSICKLCYLKMDHHCPWVNNCVGHFNHRYFFLTLVYIVLGCFFIMIFGADIVYRQAIQGVDVLQFEAFENLDFEEVTGLTTTDDLSIYWYIFSGPRLLLPLAFGKPLPTRGGETATLLFGITVTRYQLLIIICFVAALSIAAGFTLSGFAMWHARLITRGETCIEYYMNKAGRKELGQRFVNPYDVGRKRNWQIFLGLDQGSRTLLRHVLLPSAHCPSGNGYDWSHISVYQDDIKSM